jgi:hypothetical protein
MVDGAVSYHRRSERAGRATLEGRAPHGLLNGMRMKPDDLIIPPPTPRIMDYPVTIALAFGVVFTALLLIVAGRFDPSGGTLTISLLILLAFIGVVVFSIFFTVPHDETTSSVVGGLVAAMGAVIAYWLGKSKNGK